MILFDKEKQVSRLLMEHLEKVQACLEKTYAVAEEYFRGALEEAKRLGLEVDRIETEADELRRQIDDRLFAGAFLPNIRQDVHGLVSQMDDVANAAETVCDFVLGERPVIPEAWHEEMLAIFSKTLDQFAQFRAAFTEFLEGSRMDVDEIRKSNQKVGILESDIDQIEWHLTREIFRSDLELAHKLHLRTWVRLSCQLSDQIENLADSLKLLVLKTQV